MDFDFAATKPVGLADFFLRVDSVFNSHFVFLVFSVIMGGEDIKFFKNPTQFVNCSLLVILFQYLECSNSVRTKVVHFDKMNRLIYYAFFDQL